MHTFPLPFLLSCAAVLSPVTALADQLYDFTLTNPSNGNVLSFTLPTTTSGYGDPQYGGAHFVTNLYENGSLLYVSEDVYFGAGYNDLPGAAVTLYYQPDVLNEPASNETAFVAGGIYGQTFLTEQQPNGMYAPGTVAFYPGTYVPLPPEPFLGDPNYEQLSDILTITEETAVTPEPSSQLLVGTGLLCGLSLRYGRRSRCWS